MTAESEVFSPLKQGLMGFTSGVSLDGEHHLRELLVRFLAWNYAPDQCLQHSHWYVRVVEYRGKIGVMLDVSPSLRPTIPEDLAECYADAHEVASEETGLPLDVFPLTCPWTAAQVVRDALWPVDAHACDTTPRGGDDDETATD